MSNPWRLMVSTLSVQLSRVDSVSASNLTFWETLPPWTGETTCRLVPYRLTKRCASAPSMK